MNQARVLNLVICVTCCVGGVEGLAILDALPFEKEVLQSPKVNVSGLRANNMVTVDLISSKPFSSRDELGVRLGKKYKFLITSLRLHS